MLKKNEYKRILFHKNSSLGQINLHFLPFINIGAYLHKSTNQKPSKFKQRQRYFDLTSFLTKQSQPKKLIFSYFWYYWWGQSTSFQTFPIKTLIPSKENK